MRLTVIIPTYRRVDDLRRCLAALAAQTRLPDEIIVTVRDSDHLTQACLRGLDGPALPLREVRLSAPGVVAALNRAFEVATGEVLAVLDDDTAPRPDWVSRLEAHFVAAPELGALGGRDWIHQDGGVLDGQAAVVGKVQWFGRHIGRHHLGVGPARAVDVLKTANFACRRTAVVGLRFDKRLRGAGAQVHLDMAFSLAIKRAGWLVLYDPAVAVDHFPGARFGGLQRESFSLEALRDEVHNETLTLLDHLPGWKRGAFAVWALGVGTRRTPGLIQAARLAMSPLGPGGALARARATLAGRWDGWRTWLARPSVRRASLPRSA